MGICYHQHHSATAACQATYCSNTAMSVDIRIDEEFWMLALCFFVETEDELPETHLALKRINVRHRT